MRYRVIRNIDTEEALTSPGMHVRFMCFQWISTSEACDAGRSAFVPRIKHRELPQMEA